MRLPYCVHTVYAICCSVLLWLHLQGKVRTIKVEEQTDSFFNFFEPPEVPDPDDHMDEEDMEQLQEQLENDCTPRDI